MTTYFDTNIFAYLENETLSISEIEEIIGTKITKIFYSASHIQETLEIKGSTEQERIERINKRLSTIERITNSNYLYEDLENNVYKQIEKPISVFETISEVPFCQNIIKNLLKLSTEEQKQEFRKFLGIESSRLNNYAVKEVVEQLNKKLSETIQYSFLEFVEHGISYHPDYKSFGLSHRIAAIFELLDMVGYWKDKYTEKSDYARFFDSCHAYSASHCDFFISDDKRTRKKTEVVYSIYDIGTLALR